VRDEVAIAIGQRNSASSPGKLIIPVVYAECEMKWGLEINQLVSFLPPVSFDDALDQLYQAIVEYSLVATSSKDDVDVEQRLLRLGFTHHESHNMQYIVPPVRVIPAGEFLMGSDERQDRNSHVDEWPAATVSTGEYLIASYPVTVAEYRLFTFAMHVDGLVDGSEGGVLLASQGREDCPITDISWYDAWKYATWLSTCTGKRWRLPTEAEWEKAARWDPQTEYSYVYPWGDAFEPHRCNTHESCIGATTPVGGYPSGASPLGVHEMAGNVSEWTRTPFARYPYKPERALEVPQAKGIVVCRGASWHSNAWEARCACRSETRATDTRAFDVGMRLVCGGE
jgi:formylglycine-generating enzyme required for sulfatase activity